LDADDGAGEKPRCRDLRTSRSRRRAARRAHKTAQAKARSNTLNFMRLYQSRRERRWARATSSAEARPMPPSVGLALAIPLRLTKTFSHINENARRKRRAPSLNS
jgi:hypothetical protein